MEVSVFIRAQLAQPQLPEHLQEGAETLECYLGEADPELPECYTGTVSIRVIGRRQRRIFDFTLSGYRTSRPHLTVRKRDGKQRLVINHVGKIFCGRMGKLTQTLVRLMLYGLGRTIARIRRQMRQREKHHKPFRSHSRYRRRLLTLDEQVLIGRLIA